MIQTSDGGFAFAGITDRNNENGSDMWLVKIDANGHYEWDTTYGGTKNDEARSLVQTSDGGFTLAGFTESYDINKGFEGHMWLVKTNSTGHAEWNATYGNGRMSIAYSLLQMSDGDIILAGSGVSYDSSSMCLVKTNASGHLEWKRYYGNELEGGGAVYSFLQSSDGGFTLLGDCSDLFNGAQFMKLVKIDAKGIMEWNTTFRGAPRSRDRSLFQTSDGGFIFSGSMPTSNPPPYEEQCLVKVNANGIIEGYTTFGGTDYNRFRSLIQTSDGGFVFTGTTSSWDIWLAKISTITVSNNTKLTSSWTPIIIIMSLIVIVFRKREKLS